MDTLFVQAAKRGEVLSPAPITEAFPPHTPRCSRCSRQITPDRARDPARARSSPSRIDFFPSSMTSEGISSYLVSTTNFPTWFVSPRTCGKSAREGIAVLSAEMKKELEAMAPRDGLPNSRLCMAGVEILLRLYIVHPHFGVFAFAVRHSQVVAIQFGHENAGFCAKASLDRKSTRLNSSHMSISYAVFCLKKKTIRERKRPHRHRGE